MATKLRIVVKYFKQMSYVEKESRWISSSQNHAVCVSVCPAINFWTNW
jgi:hypothetical protein